MTHENYDDASFSRSIGVLFSDVTDQVEQLAEFWNPLTDEWISWDDFSSVMLAMKDLPIDSLIALRYTITNNLSIPLPVSGGILAIDLSSEDSLSVAEDNTHDTDIPPGQSLEFNISFVCDEQMFNDLATNGIVSFRMIIRYYSIFNHEDGTSAFWYYAGQFSRSAWGVVENVTPSLCNEGETSCLEGSDLYECQDGGVGINRNE